MPPDTAQPAAIECQVSDGIATLLLNRPEGAQRHRATPCAPNSSRCSTASPATMAIRAVVLTGEGKGFCAGGDIAGMQERMKAPAGEVAFNGWRRQQRVHHTQCRCCTPCPSRPSPRSTAPAIGPRLRHGAGLRLHHRGRSGQLRDESTSTAASSPTAAACTSCRAASACRSAKELIFTGRKVDADEALALGIVDRMTDRRQLVADAQRLGRRTRPGLGHRAGAGQDDPRTRASSCRREQVFAQGSQAQAICYTSTEHRESVDGLPGQERAAQGARRA